MYFERIEELQASPAALHPVSPADARASAARSPVFDRVVGPHLRCMMRTARRILRSDDLAWDAVQETLIRVWRRGDLPAEPRGVLLRLVVPGSLHVLRTLDRRRRHEEGVPPVRADSASCSDPRCELERRELRERLDQAIAGLAPALSAAFVLREIGELDYDSIALRLGVPIGTVRSRLHRARNTLRNRLATQYGRLDHDSDGTPTPCEQGARK